ncbi:hypothetical protein [Comamonas aquatica]|jgi:crossover junction endodeoxyribonuclease RuvC|uniref:Uncharacterized protein n=1 Tax=Comamonas aquatica TaxID=225991 RepID=A0AA35D5K8_9BURK|nr:hypothetical protein [Comamonas aquatica]MDH0493365.1 hypothetical protein [Comamonas aquatica]MDH1673953.1 hypothetical protein [Comamonas aquatica]MDH1677185.1 hypothetical protein [Comamonas aquatica]CAB5675666.1 Uncharacterised protein [Comamonas aquatica]CAC9685956.1 Uncharacterised protein [Comamonas aquatica]
MIVIGIDPGLTGACAVVDHLGVRAVFDLPTMPVPGAGPKALVKRKIDGRALCQLLLKHCPASEGSAQVVLEQVHARGDGNALQTQASLLRSLGAIETVLECLKYPIRYVSPQSWKRAYGLGPDKNKALETARSLYPGAQADLKRQKDHNRAEAVLLAHWGRGELA